MQALGVLIVCCLNVAIALFVLGLILGTRGAGLRRMAFVAFACALLPSLIAGLTHDAIGSLGTSGADPFAVIAGGIVVALVAYVVLEVRKRLTKSPAPPRIQMKRPYTHRQDTDVISLLRERMERDE